MFKMNYYKSRNEKRKTIIAVVVILLVLAGGYVGYNFYLGYQYQQQIAALQEGVQIGKDLTALDVLQKAVNCEVIPVWGPLQIDGEEVNVSLNLVAVECLQAPQ